MNHLPAALLALAVLAGCAPAKPPCPPSQIKCGDRCIDPLSDPSHCGACGIACGASDTCCGGACVDLRSSPANCGACGLSCGTGACSAGACTCPNGASDHCPADPWPWCRDLTTDRAHCGDCATACTQLAHEACSGGTCGCFDPAHPTTCAAQGACTNLAVDPQNCGTCGEACTLPGKTRCVGGACACAAGLHECPGLGCFDLQADEAHCGTCGEACAAGQACCAGTCRTVATDAAHCGACGHACAAGQTCSAGSCVCSGGTPRACGASCCAGTACCGDGSACQTEHSNGLGGKFYDCSATYSASNPWTQAAATRAAESWSAGTTYPGLCDGSCVGRQTANACAVWCFGASTFKGKVTTSGTTSCTAVCNNFYGNVSVGAWQ